MANDNSPNLDEEEMAQFAKKLTNVSTVRKTLLVRLVDKAWVEETQGKWRKMKSLMIKEINIKIKEIKTRLSFSSAIGTHWCLIFSKQVHLGNKEMNDETNISYSSHNANEDERNSLPLWHQSL